MKKYRATTIFLIIERYFCWNLWRWLAFALSLINAFSFNRSSNANSFWKSFTSFYEIDAFIFMEPSLYTDALPLASLLLLLLADLDVTIVLDRLTLVITCGGDYYDACDKLDRFLVPS